MFNKRAIRVNFLNHSFNSKWELLVFKTLTSVIPREYLPIKVNQRVPGSRFELDFFIPKLKLGFELQGPCHFNIFKNIRRDLLKYSFCKKIGIRIIYLICGKYYNKSFFRKIFY